MSGEIQIRRELRSTDRDDIVRMHGVLYRREYGLSPNMERHVAASVDAALERGWPETGGGIWIVERDGEFAGSVGFTDDGDRRATLRWFLFDPSVRGRGVGKRLVGEVVDEVESQGYELIWLETLGILTTAAKIYRGHGFTVVHEQMGPPWGDPDVPYQRYELALPRSVHGRDDATGSARVPVLAQVDPLPRP